MSKKLETKISESIFDNRRVLIPMADVQHIEYLKDNGCWVIMKSTKYDYEVDIWNNPVWLSEEETPVFIKAYCFYRYEKDIKENER